MTDVLCYADSYLKEFDAVVTSVTPKGAILDRTAFYPGGGGQPADSGVLTVEGVEYRVKKVARADGEYVHEIDGDLPEVGASVHGVIDWERRHQLMRTHTALHILCGVVWRDYGAKVTGGNMEPLSARMDFELENMSAEFAREVEELINKEVEAARPIEIGNLSREEAFETPRSHSHQDQPAASGHQRDTHRRHHRPRLAGRWRYARRQHQRGRHHQGGKAREQGAHQQAPAHRGGHVALIAYSDCICT